MMPTRWSAARRSGRCGGSIRITCRATIPTRPSAPSGPRRFSTDGRVLLRPRLFVAGGGAGDPCRHRRRRSDCGNDAHRRMAPSSSPTRATASISSTETRPGTTLADDLAPGDARDRLDPAGRSGRPGAAPSPRRSRGVAEPRVDRILFDSRRLWRFRRRLDRRGCARPGRSTSAASCVSRSSSSGATFAAARGVPLAIFRLAGIYGPGRSAFDKLRAGDARRIVKPGQVFNRIHVEDIGRITMLAAQREARGHLQSRRRRAGAAAGPRHACGGDDRDDAAARGAVRDGGDVADGALVLFRQQAGLERARSRRRSASSCSIRPIARGSRRSTEHMDR